MIIIGTPHIRGAGYFVNDKNLKTRQEADVKTCGHCRAVIKMQEWAKVQGGWCSKCSQPLCSQPACVAQTARLGCVPFTQQIDQAIDAVIKLDKYLKMVPHT